MDIVTHAVCLLGCEQNIMEIMEWCDKPVVAVVCERSQKHSDLWHAPRRMCRGHAWMHSLDPMMEVTWLIPIPKAKHE